MFNPKKKEKYKKATRFSLPAGGGGRWRRHSDLGYSVVMVCEDIPSGGAGVSGWSSQGTGASTSSGRRRISAGRSQSSASCNGRECRVVSSSSSSSPPCADGQVYCHNVRYRQAPRVNGDQAFTATGHRVKQHHGSARVFYSTKFRIFVSSGNMFSLCSRLCWRRWFRMYLESFEFTLSFSFSLCQACKYNQSYLFFSFTLSLYTSSSQMGEGRSQLSKYVRVWFM